MLDKSYMGGATAAAYIAGQAELAVNGNFATGDLTGWAQAQIGTAPVCTVVGGEALIPRIDGSNFRYLSQAFAGLTVGRWYRATARCGAVATLYRVGNVAFGGSIIGATALATNATTTILFRADATTDYITFYANSDGTTAIIDDLSLKEIPGFHAIAPSDAARPLLTVSGGLAYLTTDGVDDWMNVSPTLNLGEAWWSVAGWRNGGSTSYAFGTSTSANGGMRSETTAERWVNSAATIETIAAGTTTNDHVLTVQQASTISLSGRFNGATGSTITPNDDSGATQGLALFSRVNNSWSIGYAGRFYGGAFAPGAITASDRAIMERYAATLSGVTL